MAGPAIDACLMLPVTIQAPAHLETGRAGDPLHGGHLAVAAAAVDLGAYMHHVRKIDMVRQAVDLDPFNRLLPVPVFHQFLDFRSIRGDVQVARTAIRQGRDTGDGRLGGIVVTVEARDAVCTGMQLMAEDEWLDRRAFAEIQRQNVHKCQTGDNSAYRDDQHGNKPRYFHAIHQ